MSPLSIGPLVGLRHWTEQHVTRPEQTPRWAEYRIVTLRGRGVFLEDLSFSVMAGNVVLGVCYCFLVSGHGEGRPRIVSNGDGLVTVDLDLPLGSVRDRALYLVARHLTDLCALWDATAEVLLHPSDACAVVSSFGKCEVCPPIVATHELIVDLDRPLSQVWGEIRKSYKPLIRGSRWSIEVSVSSLEDSHADMNWNEVRELHRRVSGSQTRGSESWIAQYRAIKDGGGMVVFARRGGSLVGASVVEWGKGFAQYGTGVYERELLALGAPLGHKCQWAAIEFLHSIGLKEYSLGIVPGDLDGKTSGILQFKEGFARQRAKHLVFRLCNHNS